jgi:hypothetical protein
MAVISLLVPSHPMELERDMVIGLYPNLLQRKSQAPYHMLVDFPLLTSLTGEPCL